MHGPPAELTDDELDACTAAIESGTGVTRATSLARGRVPVSAMEPALRSRLRSAVMGEVGRNRAGADAHRSRRIPVRATDPSEFFAAKLSGRLLPERV
jgi:hypothetical protein